MAQYIDKDALVAEIKARIKDIKESQKAGLIKKRDADKKIFLFKSVLSLVDTLEVKEVDLDLITGWFDHIAQIADDRMTLTGQRMTDSHALDEIKCLAKNSSEFITKHYKAQKGE